MPSHVELNQVKRAPASAMPPTAASSKVPWMASCSPKASVSPRTVARQKTRVVRASRNAAVTRPPRRQLSRPLKASNMEMPAGPRTAMNRQGRMQKISGMRILTATF